MPTLPTYELRNQAPRTRYPEVQPGPGTYVARGLGQLSEGFDYQARLNDASDKTEAARIVSESRALFSAAISEENLSKGDYNEFRESATTRLTELHQKALETENPRVRGLVQGALQDDLIRSQTIIKQETFKKQKDKVGADYLTTMDQLSKSSVGADEATQRRNAADFSVLQASLVQDGFITREQAVKDAKKYRDDIAVHTANQMISNGAADQVLRDDSEGRWNNIDPAARERVINAARTQMDRDERNADRAVSEVKKVVMNGWQAAANRGELGSKYAQELKDALDGKNPYITAAEARTLNEVDRNPPTGGNDSVKALASEYYLSPRTLPHINATRAKLRALQAQIGRPDPNISKLANELQADQTTMENQGISREANEIARQGREIRNLQTTYEAWVEQNPFMKKFLGNVNERDKARIADTYRREGADAAKSMVDQLIKGQTQKQTEVEKKHGKALNYGQ